MRTLEAALRDAETTAPTCGSPLFLSDPEAPRPPAAPTRARALVTRLTAKSGPQGAAPASPFAAGSTRARSFPFWSLRPKIRTRTCARWRSWGVGLLAEAEHAEARVAAELALGSIAVPAVRYQRWWRLARLQGEGLARVPARRFAGSGIRQCWHVAFESRKGFPASRARATPLPLFATRARALRTTTPAVQVGCAILLALLGADRGRERLVEVVNAPPAR